MPVQGFTSLRSWALGKQSTHGTAVSPSLAVPWGGVLEVDPQWQDVEGVDVGSIDPVLAPVRGALDITAPLSGPLGYNQLPIIAAAAWRGGVSATGGGAAKTWTHQALSLTATTLDEFTGQWTDDVTTEGFRFWDGVIETVELSFDETLGPWQASVSWRFGSVNPRVTPITGLLLSSNTPWVYGADTALYIDSTAAGIGSTQISDALRGATITIENTIDVKRYANGSNTRFAVAGYGLTRRSVRAAFTFDKAAGIIGSSGEIARWLAADPVQRYLRIAATSQAVIPTTSTPYSWDFRLSGDWRTNTPGEVGGNATVQLELVNRYDATLGYPIYQAVVCDRATLT